MTSNSIYLRNISLTLISILFLVSCASKETRSSFPYADSAEDIKNSEQRKLQSPLSKESSEDPSIASDPILQPGFTLEISNIEDRKLNGQHKIDFDSTLHLPYGVILNTSNMKLSDLKKELSNSYRKFFNSLLSFNVLLVERQYLIEVRGLVEKPNKFSIEPHTSLDTIIGLAGGLSKALPPKYLRIVRKNHQQYAISIVDYFKAGSQFSDLEINAGDTMFFQVDSPEQSGVSMLNFKTIELMGEVKNPGPLTFQQGRDLYDYILQAGGPAPMADLSHIRIIRGPSQYRLISELDILEEEKHPVIRPGDLILVPFDKPTTTEKKILQAGTFASIISTIAVVLIMLGVR